MTMHANEKTILVIEARYYEKITDDMVKGAEPVFTAAGFEIERLAVTGCSRCLPLVKWRYRPASRIRIRNTPGSWRWAV